jgi:hypothetical protein
VAVFWVSCVGYFAGFVYLNFSLFYDYKYKVFYKLAILASVAMKKKLSHILVFSHLNAIT